AGLGPQLPAACPAQAERGEAAALGIARRAPAEPAQPDAGRNREASQVHGITQPGTESVDPGVYLGARRASAGKGRIGRRQPLTSEEPPGADPPLPRRPLGKAADAVARHPALLGEIDVVRAPMGRAAFAGNADHEIGPRLERQPGAEAVEAVI